MFKGHYISLLTAGLILAACSSSQPGSPTCGDNCDEFVSAICETQLVGNSRVLDVELEYLPQVLACENAPGSYESLKALAIASRSYLYYKLTNESHTITSGDSDQVFKCNTLPSLIHRQAVEATSGQILRYKGTQVAGFHIAGAFQDGPTCKGGRSGPFSWTEKRVTYNEGLSGNNIHQSSSGWIAKKNHANRGSMSQNGADCLADLPTGKSAAEIIRFYFGSDIEITQASGACVIPLIDAPPQDGESWIGEDCAYDTSICDFSVNERASECLEWYDDGPAQGLYGFCSIQCEGYCPGKAGEPSSFCAELYQDKGHCAIAPSAENSYCENISDTEALVVKRWVGNSGAPATYQGVCAPPGGNPIECAPSSGEQGEQGECIDTDSMQCGGNLKTGFCPGGSNIVCCVP